MQDFNGNLVFPIRAGGSLAGRRQVAAKEKQLKADSLKGKDETGNWFNSSTEFTDN